jgi:hypothetical protein
MFADLLNALGQGSYLAHSFCLTNDPWIIGLYIVHDLMIFVAYAIIAAVNYLSRGALSGPSYIGLSAFILLCGISHLTKTSVMFWGIYRLDVVVVVATAWISASTAAYVVWGFVRWRKARHS